MAKAANERSLLRYATTERSLIQLAADVAERGAELGAEAVHDGDDRDRNPGGDQAVLDSRCTGLILGE